MKIDYEKAQLDENLRQDFLNEYLKQNPDKAVSKIVYNKDGKEFLNFIENKMRLGKINQENKEALIESFKQDEEKDMEALAFCARGSIGIGQPTKIFVTQSCFKLKKEDFDSVLLDHEYIHAKHIREGLNFKSSSQYTYIMHDLFNDENIGLLDESIAYNHTLNKAKEKNNFSEFIKGCMDNLINLTRILENLKEFKSLTEELTVKEQIEENKKVIKEYYKL